MYQERRSLLKEKLKNIAHISLTTDLWLNPRRNHFIVITAHYLDEYHQHLSDIISFRRFRGRHFSVRLKSFIINEIKKLNTESKIISITTDSGSDIKTVTSSYEFGLRFSCDAHNINQTISTGLGLWKVSASKKSKNTYNNKNDNIYYVPIIFDGNESDYYSDNSDEYDDDLTQPISQQDRQLQEDENDHELELLLSNLVELKK
ncbi:unnamed protein product [Rotaria magnacalcarata]|uniref:Uncharacterized protein n=1 Tax=Rotaria magnacalcarata TaxID=392030 RepID=A0A819XZQ9_9BILA|nr:unnamed protein product [Rotaria magnacalcarata]